MENNLITLREFIALPTEEVARHVQAAGPQVCVFPLNGTRRWFAMEHNARRSEYVSIASKEYIRLFQILYELGINTILSPIFGGELLQRGEEYVAETLGSLAFLESENFYRFYDELGVRVHFYGNYSTVLTGTPYSDLFGVVERITDRTENNQQFRLFYGLFADDATQAIANYSIDFFKQTGKIPDRKDLVTAYYGEYVEPVSLFIGFDKPSVFDYPLLSIGEEDLYFTAAPSPYLDERTLRIILYDHIFSRQVKEPDWFSMPSADRNRFREYYLNNKDTIIGNGILDGNVWLPFSE